jgi:hypothetical protein
MTTPTPAPAPAWPWAPDDPVGGRLVVVGCSRRKRDTAVPVPAFELYEGGCVPALRRRLGASPAHRARVRILSAEHGVLTPDQPVAPYDRRLTPDRVEELSPRVRAQVLAEAAVGVPRELLVVAEPLYLHLLADLFRLPGRLPRLTWISANAGWPDAAAVLDAWGWP